MAEFTRKTPDAKMQHTDLDQFLSTGKPLLAEGPVAMIFVEDDIEVDSTIRHHLKSGFGQLLVMMPDGFALAADIAEQVHRIRFDLTDGDDQSAAINKVIAAAPGTWIYYCYNAEYLFFPFCETRTVGEMLTFHAEERRNAMLAYVVDLYADDLEAHPDAVSLDTAYLDKSGYYSLARKDPDNHHHPRERQLEFFGGLRWRFEEHIPAPRRNIDRISLFRARPDLMMGADYRFNDQEYNTYACPWHNNLTAAIASFRTAKALKRNPGSTFDIKTFKWHNSTPFEWQSGQLLDLGLIEPGQWF